MNSKRKRKGLLSQEPPERLGRESLSSYWPRVQADVTEGSKKSATAIGNDSDVICATGFEYSWDLVPWKVTTQVRDNLLQRKSVHKQREN
ncbi:hypothetical protein R6Q57_010871 [Mikania cordata]